MSMRQSSLRVLLFALRRLLVDRVKIVSLTSAGLRIRNKIVRAATTQSPLARLSREDQQQLHDLLARTIGADTSRSQEGSDGATTASPGGSKRTSPSASSTSIGVRQLGRSTPGPRTR